MGVYFVGYDNGAKKAIQMTPPAQKVIHVNGLGTGP
jgi:hypothetical protein